jgi:hypothetical protein
VIVAFRREITRSGDRRFRVLPIACGRPELPDHPTALYPDIPMKKIVLTFGIISGLIMSAMFVITIPFHDRMSMEQGLVIGYASMLAASLLIYFGIRSYRDNEAGGKIGFGRAFAVGILIATVSGVLYVTTWEIVYPRFMPDYFEKYKEHQLEEAREKGATPTEIEALRVKTDRDIATYTHPVWSKLIVFLEPLPVGLVVTLISAWMLSRGRKAEMPLASSG